MPPRKKSPAHKKGSSHRGSKPASDAIAELRLTGKLPKGVSTAAAKSVLEVFQRFDTDRNGSISHQELANVMQALDAATWTEERLDCLFRSMDVNRDEGLNLAELISWIFSEGDLQFEFKEVADHISGMDEIAIRVFALDGSELALVRLPPTATVHALKASLSPKVMVPIEEQEILFKEEKLADKHTLFHVGIAAEGFVNFMRVPRVRSEKARNKHIQSLCDKFEKEYHDILLASQKVSAGWFLDKSVRKELRGDLELKNQEIQDCLERQKTEVESSVTVIGAEHELDKILPQLIEQCDQIRADLSSGSRQIECAVPRDDRGAKERELHWFLQSEEKERKRRAASDADISTVAHLWRRSEALCIPLKDTEEEFVKSLLLPSDLDSGFDYGYRCLKAVQQLYYIHCEYNLVCRLEDVARQRIQQLEAELLSLDAQKILMDRFLYAMQKAKGIPEELNRVIAMRDSLINEYNAEVEQTHTRISQMCEATESMLAENAGGSCSFSKVMSSWHNILMQSKDRSRERGEEAFEYL